MSDRELGGIGMAQTTMVNFRIDEDVKKDMEEVCSRMGLTMTAALNIFINKEIGRASCRERV